MLEGLPRSLDLVTSRRPQVFRIGSFLIILFVVRLNSRKTMDRLRLYYSATFVLAPSPANESAVA